MITIYGRSETAVLQGKLEQPHCHVVHGAKRKRDPLPQHAVRRVATRLPHDLEPHCHAVHGAKWKRDALPQHAVRRVATRLPHDLEPHCHAVHGAYRKRDAAKNASARG